MSAIRQKRGQPQEDSTIPAVNETNSATHCKKNWNPRVHFHFFTQSVNAEIQRSVLRAAQESEQTEHYNCIAKYFGTHVFTFTFSDAVILSPEVAGADVCCNVSTKI